MKIYGRTHEELFTNGALGFYSLVTDWGPGFAGGYGERKKKIVRLCFSAENMQELFFAWLRELVFYFSARRMMLEDFHFSFSSQTSLELRAREILFDPRKHEPKIEIKAVTYHLFEVTQGPEGFEATVIFDV